MYVNKSNQLYKPKRVLYYMDATEKIVNDFLKGKIDDRVNKYNFSFGTYDYPGLFYIRKLNKKVLGIEYRIDDDRISYPTDLESMILDDNYFYSIEVENEVVIDDEFIDEMFKKIKFDDDAHRIYSDLELIKNYNILSIFTSNNKIRVLYEMRITSDRAKIVINDDKEKMDKEMLYNKSFIDPITNHYNWNHMAAFLEMPEDYGIKDYIFAHFDIKEFRILNEVYGHIAANKVLCNIVKKMNKEKFIYTSARCHNDNFCMIMEDMPDDQIVKKLEEFFDDLSYLEEDPNYKICYRCGVVPMQRAMLLGNRVADAGKLAQKLGINNNKTDIVVYTDKMHDDIVWSTFIKAYLDTAIVNDEFLVYLQPKFDLNKEQLQGAEALVRWNYKKKEMLTPNRFIPFFEKDSSVGKIDEIVLKKVCQALARWIKMGKKVCPFSVNLSRKVLYSKNLLDHVTEIIDSYNIPHNLIDFELTESATYDDSKQMIQILNNIRECGFKISMDDFGTGYSSLSMLTQMPLDTLKIDKSFVDNVGTSKEKESDIVVIKHIISLAKELNFICLAEGAEEKSQIDKLKELGCEVVQGYYYSKPMPIEEFEEKYL